MPVLSAFYHNISPLNYIGMLLYYEGKLIQRLPHLSIILLFNYKCMASYSGVGEWFFNHTLLVYTGILVCCIQSNTMIWLEYGIKWRVEAAHNDRVGKKLDLLRDIGCDRFK